MTTTDAVTVLERARLELFKALGLATLVGKLQRAIDATWLWLWRHLWESSVSLKVIHTRFGQWVEQRFLATVAAQMGAQRLHGTKAALKECADRDTLPSVDVEFDDDHPSGIGAATEPPSVDGVDAEVGT